LGMEDYSGAEVPESRKHAYRPESEGKQSVQGSIAIKGTRSGLLLTLEAGMPFSELLQALAQRIEESPTFFRGASLTVDTTQRALRVSERLQLEKLLAQYQMSIAAGASEKEPKQPKPSPYHLKRLKQPELHKMLHKRSHKTSPLSNAIHATTTTSSTYIAPCAQGKLFIITVA